MIFVNNFIRINYIIDYKHTMGSRSVNARFIQNNNKKIGRF